MSQPVNDDAIDFFEIDEDITLRRMVLRNSNPKGTVLFLHGFPETLYAWKDIAKALADDYEVHAFDWPGYGLSSRPTVDRFSYTPRDYARVVDRYIEKVGIDTSKLTIYATDIGALPTLLLAVEKADIAKTIIVGDFAPFNRPQFMYASRSVGLLCSRQIDGPTWQRPLLGQSGQKLLQKFVAASGRRVWSGSLSIRCSCA